MRAHPAKVATPLVRVLSGLAVQLSEPDEGVSVIEADEDGDHVATGVFDLDHRLVGLKAPPLSSCPATVVNTSWVAAPVGEREGVRHRGGQPVSPLEVTVRL